MSPPAGSLTGCDSGWGTVSVKNAMNGPGQFTGIFQVNTQGTSDTWSNDIGDTAIKARQAEDAAEAATWTATKAANGWANGVPANASDDDNRGETRRDGLSYLERGRAFGHLARGAVRKLNANLFTHTSKDTFGAFANRGCPVPQRCTQNGITVRRRRADKMYRALRKHHRPAKCRRLHLGL